MKVEIPEADPKTMAEATALAEGAPVPAIAQNVRFGTAGWTDKTLIASHAFYPRGASSSAARLEHYARHFSIVEVDATYYTLIPPDTVQRWVSTTPPEFVFDVKAHPILTGHPVDIARLPPDLRQALQGAGAGGRVYPDRMPEVVADEIRARFRALLEPLLSASRLGCVMLQFPPWFTATRANSRKIEELAERWPELPLGVEFRHKSWLLPERRDRVLDLLGRYHLSYIAVDEPDVPRGGVPPLFAVTNPELAIVRFHGKNSAGWQKRAATVHERFDYLYSPAGAFALGRAGARARPRRARSSRRVQQLCPKLCRARSKGAVDARAARARSRRSAAGIDGSSESHRRKLWLESELCCVLINLAGVTAHRAKLGCGNRVALSARTFY